MHLRSKQYTRKRLLIHPAAFNLGLILRQVLGAGTPRQVAALPRGCLRKLFRAYSALLGGAGGQRTGLEA